MRPIKKAITHDPSLISTLEEQHKAIMLKYITVFELAKAKNYSELMQSLEQFYEMLSEHFRCERELYIYLEREGNNKTSFRDVKAEMKKIAMNTRSTLNLHKNIPISDTTIHRFTRDFSALGEDLMERIRYERKYLFEDYTQQSL